MVFTSPVARSTTEIAWPPESQTYSVVPFGVMSIPSGHDPTRMGAS